MEINADFSERVLVHSDELDWLASPMPGVERRMLDRIGDEVARATSIVRYAPGSHFSAHTHGGGEEFIVLEGVFQDEHSDYPAGTYVRNPPTSAHVPGSDAGCTIFVKLWQFDPEDRTQLATDMNALVLPDEAARPGVRSTTLHHDAHETVLLLQLAAGAHYAADVANGAELLVLEGTLTESNEAMRRNSWLRIPTGDAIDVVAGESGARVWIKLGGIRPE